jgi:hypothetical protein
MDSLLEFCKDSGGWGVASEVAALAVFSVGLWEHFHDKAVAPFVLIGISVPLFWAGAFVAWYKKRKDTIDLRAQLADRNPDLRLNLEGVLYVYDAGVNLTVFVLSAYLVNAGEPSVAMTWSATYLMGQSRETMVGFNVRGSYSITLGKETLTLTNDSLLQTQVLTHRIDRGDAKAGRLLFTLPGNRLKDIETRKFKIEVQCIDFTRKATTAEFIPDSTPFDGLKSYPGEQVQIGSTQPESVAYTQPRLPEGTK